MNISINKFKISPLKVVIFWILIFAPYSFLNAAQITVTSKNDSGVGTLRNAITVSSSGDTILFSSLLNGDSIVLTSGQITIDKNLTIIGNDARKIRISGNANTRIFEIQKNIKFNIEGISLSNGKASGTGLSSSGGIIFNRGKLSIQTCYLSNGHAYGSGGAIYNMGEVNIYESTLAYNKADSNGGAITNIGGLVKVINSTITANYAGYQGGGIFQKSISSTIPVSEFISCTIAYNNAKSKGGGLTNTYVNFQDTTIFYFQGTIVAMNKSAINYGNDISRDLSSRCYVLSNGNNMIGNSDSAGFVAKTGDVVGNSTSMIDPHLGKLKDNGGTTPTLALECGSPALDFGDPFTPLSTDQRGEPRKFAGIPDVGAYETQKNMYTPDFTIGKDADTCIGIVIKFNANRPSDSVNWIRPSGKVLLANSQTFNFVSGRWDTIICEVISSSGCPGYDTAIVKLKDLVKPVITNCPSNLNLSSGTGSCEAIANWTAPTATDNCNIDTFYSTHKSGDKFNTGTTTVVYTAKDDAGNTTTCSFKVIVKDMVLPVIGCIGDIQSINEAGKCGGIVSFIPPVGTDNCPGSETKRTTGLSPGDFYPCGKTLETYIITDASGNTDTCEFDITVKDTEKPSVTCPNDTTLSTDSGACSAIVVYQYQYFDNCTNPTVTLLNGLASGSAFPKGITEVKYKVEDAFGNFDTCSFFVIVTDNSFPTITCPGNIESCDSIITFSNPVFTDNCPGSNLLQLSGLISGSVYPVGTTIQKYEVVDLSGNKASCSFNIKRNPIPKIDAGKDTTIFYGDAIILMPDASDSCDFQWSPSDYLDDPTQENPWSSPEQSVTYKLRVTNQFGCFADDSVKVIVKFELVVPTAFTPGNKDGLGKNDIWEIKGIKKYPDCEISVYSIWGNPAFESKGYNEAWDGTNNGIELPSGTYFYFLNLNDGSEPLTGNITIIR